MARPANGCDDAPSHRTTFHNSTGTSADTAPAIDRDTIALAFGQASSLLDRAEGEMCAGWDLEDMEHCAALLAGARAILDQARAKVLPMEGLHNA